MSKHLKTTDPEPTFLVKVIGITIFLILASILAVPLWGIVQFIFTPQCELGRNDRPIYADGCIP